MLGVVRDLTSPSVSTRTRSKSSSNTTIDTGSIKAAKSRAAQQVDGEKAEKLPTKKRKREMVLPVLPANQKASSIRQINNGEEAVFSLKKEKKIVDSLRKDENEEKRLRRFREQAPQSYLERLSRANSQRMFIISRAPNDIDGFPQERIEIAGSTGNIYYVDIGLIPSCTCPDNKKGNQCKHIIYVLRNVLKAPSRLLYQLAFLSSELHEIFSRAPPPLTSSTASSSSPSNRKEVSGDCPICFTAFEPETEEIVWCKAACGNNIHKTCFEQWAQSKGAMGIVRCVFCRTLWQEDEDSTRKVKTKGRLNEEGYMNVGDQLGLPSERDSSTYHQFRSWRPYRYR